MTDPTPTSHVITALDTHGCNPRGGPTKWTARCPVQTAHTHGDKNPSLSVAESPTGVALITCHKGCTTPDVVAALGLTMRDLFPPTEHTTPTGVAVTNARYPYYDEHGELLYEVIKILQDDGRKTFRARKPYTNGNWTWSVAKVRRVF